MGDIVNVDGVHLVVLGWENPGQVEILVFNRSEYDCPVFVQNQMYLMDAESGVKYPANPMLTILSSTDVNRMLRPGDWIHGDFAFLTMVMVDISNGYLIYDMDGTGNTLVKFQSPPSPIQIEIPFGIEKALTGEQSEIGETFQCGNLEIKIDNPRVIGQEAFLPPMPLSSYIVYDIYVKNTGDYEVTFDALDSIHLVDSDFHKYQQSFMALGAVQGKFPKLQTLNPNQSISGQIGFEIPNNIEGLFLYTIDYGDAKNRVVVAN